MMMIRTLLLMLLISVTAFGQGGSPTSDVTVEQLQKGQFLSCVDTRSTDDYACAISPSVTALTTYMVVRFRANTANTGSATFNLNGRGTKTLKKWSAGSLVSLSTGDIGAGQLVQVQYDGTYWQIIGQLGSTVVAGVSSFNGRTGTVTPASNDYTYTQIGNVPQGFLVGRGAAVGTGALQTITLGTNLSLSGTTLNASGGGGGGTVTGSGTVGRIPLWSGSTTNLSNSAIEDTGALIAITNRSLSVNLNATVIGNTYIGSPGSNFNSSTDGHLNLTNLAGTGFTRFTFGTTAKSRIEPSATGFSFGFNASGNAGIEAGQFVAGPSSTTTGGEGFKSCHVDGCVTFQANDNSGTPYTSWIFRPPIDDGTGGMFLRSVSGSGSTEWAKVDLTSSANVDGILSVTNGGTGRSSITATAIPVGNGTSGVTVTGVTINGSNDLSTPGSLTTGVGGSEAGNAAFGQGSATAVAANKVQIQGAVSITGYNLVLPSAAGNGFIVNDNSSNVVTQTFTNAERLLLTTASVDMNTATATTLYTCPTGKTCVITRVLVRNASTSLTTASYSFGWNSATFDNVIANATHTELTGATLYTMLDAKVGSTLGTSTGTFKVLMNTLQGGAATTTMDVFGYFF